MKKAKILILGSEKDAHVQRIGKIIRSLGSDFFALNVSEFDSEYLEALDVNNSQFRICSNGVELDLHEFTAVWFRRLSYASKPLNLADSSAQAWAIESKLAAKSSIGIFQNAVKHWYNKYYEAIRAEDKSVQLLASIDSRIKVPATLFSNDPVSISAFAKQNPQGIVHKMHHQATFSGAKRAAGTYLISENAIERNANALKLCSGIFQEYLAFDEEVRVFIVNSLIISARLINNHRPGVDIRDNFMTAGSVFEMTLPPIISERILKLMTTLGLRTASIDMGIYKGEYFLLDVNQGGNFLWMDELLPSLQLGEKFARELINS